MKIKLNNFAIFAFLFVIFGGASFAHAQSEPIVGGYAKTSVTDKEVVAAAKFAVKKRGQTTKSSIGLLSIKNAEQQVVAGMNYQLCLQVSIKGKKKKTTEEFVQVVVYRSLRGAYSLTSWTAQACAEQ